MYIYIYIDIVDRQIYSSYYICTIFRVYIYIYVYKSYILYVLRMFCTSPVIYRGHQITPMLGGIKQYKPMAILRDFPYSNALGW